MIGIYALALAVVTLLLSANPAYASSQAMVISLPKTTMLPSDVIVFYYEGSSDINVLTSENEHMVFEKVEGFGGGRYQGHLAMSFKPSNKSWVDNVIVAFYSAQPFNVNVTLYHTATDTSFYLGSYNCPANVTVQFVLPVRYVVYQSTTQQTTEWQKLLFSAESPLWRFLLYGAFFAMFGASWLLDAKDFKQRKGRRWTKQDSIALLIRYFFYASLFILFITSMVALGKLLFNVFALGSFELSLGMVVESAGILLLFAALYGLAKWRDWFDVIDEEE
ncbi:MAG: hypothetical protein DRJ33_03815 [Candidatus Methanomethylicota archaeon]|uniref:Uncharacterized protein n=1 Tax=Thermoproteota archaeon TaxID=2056631 RepID=A0A497F0L3_9CREN|nr:MAG: hypothetical protein DRJ33_03815 [Candidatus Verstraetearchaeota archaeon]